MLISQSTCVGILIYIIYYINCLKHFKYKFKENQSLIENAVSLLERTRLIWAHVFKKLLLWLTWKLWDIFETAYENSK